jgi:hypothetical protein
MEGVLPTGGYAWDLQDLDKWTARRLRMVQLKQWKGGVDDLSGTAKAESGGADRLSGGGLEWRLVENPNRRIRNRMSGGVGGE